MAKIINTINSPRDIKGLSNDEMKILAEEIRQFIIDSVASTGGHLSSNLGIVEITLGLHKVFNSPEDKILFDIGHQSYTHKIITGRREAFTSLRQPEGISGFIKLDESDHDVWESAHAGNALAAAAAYALKNPKNWVACIIGDGTLTNGQLFEALNNVGDLKQLNNLMIILNDNEMSISPSVGGTSKMLDTLRTSRKIYKFRHQISMKYFSKFDNKMSNAIKRGGLNKAGSFFEAIDLHYLGIYNGNDFSSVVKALENAKKIDIGPKILHFSTSKGLGHDEAQQDVVGSYHGVNKAGQAAPRMDVTSWSKAIADIVQDKMKVDDKIEVITPAMLVGSKLNDIKKEFPNRTYDVGIAEPYALNFAAGLAVNGYKPFVSIYSTFLQRAYDGVLHDCAINSLPVVIGIDRAGFSPGDGERNHGIYDISFLLSIPNTIVAMPANIDDAKKMLDLAFDNNDKIFCIRYPRTNVSTTTVVEKNFKIGEWEEIKKGDKLAIVTYGDNVSRINGLVKDMQNVSVINARFMKPMDTKMLEKICQEHHNILVVEEATAINSLNYSIAAFMMKKRYYNELDVLAIDDNFYFHGTQESLEKSTKLDDETILNKIKGIINETS